MALAMSRAAGSLAQQLLPAAGALLPALATAGQLQPRRTKMSHSEASEFRALPPAPGPRPAAAARGFAGGAGREQARRAAAPLRCSVTLPAHH